jgi:hypothetical protein
MATLLTRPEVKIAGSDQGEIDERLARFLAELGELSRRFGLAIGDGAYIYLIEPEDFARSYLANSESGLTFA